MTVVVVWSSMCLEHQRDGRCRLVVKVSGAPAWRSLSSGRQCVWSTSVTVVVVLSSMCMAHQRDDRCRLVVNVPGAPA